MADVALDEAIGWSVRLHHHAPDPAAQAGFERWLGAAPAHVDAWQRVQALRADFAGLPPRLVLDTLHTTEVLHSRQRVNRRRAGQLLGLAGVAFAATWLGQEHTPWQRVLADASTATGERHSLTLTDGTLVELNTDTAVRTHDSDAGSSVTLLRGEIRVTTGHARSGVPHSFSVFTPHGTLQPLGTRFTARLDEGRARVSVQQGAVRLQPTTGASATVPAGNSAWLADNGVLPAAPPAIDAEAFAEGVIAGSAMRLADVLAELSRHRPGRIVCDARVANLPISGVYQLHDTTRVLQLLADTQPVKVRMLTRWWVVVEP